ncbi:hypothetical protein [Thiomicrorhabdus chilensis]|uniref:hypothetical protein n=1 Tax=Thiomicrorhabdus chilensis TaxID=63656 RepID=UPI0039AEE74A
MDFGLLIIFWYGVLHAFGPDHLTAIADFSIGRQRKKVLMVTLGFAIGHGVSLYLFALLLSSMQIPEGWLEYGDVIASIVIILMGVYLLYLVLTDRIHISKHEHEGREHVHVWFGKEHHHKRPFFNWLSTSAMLGILMGMGGARGMLVSLSVISSEDVSGWMVLSFTLGVALVFVVFGVILALMNARLMGSKHWLKGTFAFAGVISCGVGLQTFL